MVIYALVDLPDLPDSVKSYRHAAAAGHLRPLCVVRSYGDGTFDMRVRRADSCALRYAIRVR